MTISCLCGPQSILNTSSGGLALGGEATYTLTAAGGAIAFGGSASITIGNSLSYGFQNLFHLQEEEEPYDNDGIGVDATNATEYTLERVRGLFGGYCQQFTGLQALSIDPEALDTSKPFTTSFWIGLDDYYNKRIVYNQTDFQIGYNVLGQFELVADIGEDEPQYTTGSTINLFECWHHCLIEYAPYNHIKVYCDGVLEKTREISYALTASDSATMGGVNSLPIARIQEFRQEYRQYDGWLVEYLYLNGCGRQNAVGSWESASESV